MVKNNAPESTIELADVFCKYGKAYIESHPMPLEHYKIMNAVVLCRTAALGGHVQVCDTCGKTQIYTTPAETGTVRSVRRLQRQDGLKHG